MKSENGFIFFERVSDMIFVCQLRGFQEEERAKNHSGK